MKKVFIPLVLFATSLSACHDCSEQSRQGDYRIGYKAGQKSKENGGSNSCLDTWIYQKEEDEQAGNLPTDKQCICSGYEDGYNGKSKSY